MMTFLLVFLLGLLGPVTMVPDEPDARKANEWWPEQCNVWTPMGWPDHYFKYAVLYNGTVLSTPAVPDRFRPLSHQWADDNFQLTFCASADGRPFQLPPAVGRVNFREWDGGIGVQEWDGAHQAPLLNTEFRSKDGIVIRASMFAHIPGAKAVETALEPQYLWIRLEVVYVDAFYHPERYSVSTLLSDIFLGHKDFHKVAPEIIIKPALAVCSRSLSLQPAAFGTEKGYYVLLNDGRVRLGVISGGEEKVSLTGEAGARYDLCITFPAREGAYVDLLLPSLPEAQESFDREVSLSFPRALAESDAYWAAHLASEGAVFDVPEEALNRSVAANLRFTSILSEKNYKTGDYSYLSGTWGYDALWATPGAMVFAMFMDPMGRFKETERYTEVFAKYQGTEIPKGPSYHLHPGYFCVPRPVASVDWLSDHGAIMYQIATHGLLSGDPSFIARWTEPLLKACDFIIDHSLAEHPGIAGLLPAAWASDEEVPLQAIWNIAWCYKGMAESVRLLSRAGHPRADELSAFLRQYKERFQTEYRKICANGPKWTDAKGNIRFRPPAELEPPQVGSRHQASGRAPGQTSMTDAFYLDTGPMCLVWAGLMEAEDPIMQDVVAFFREGPNWRLHKPFPWSLDRPVLEHEISSCEPCYSFNIFHSWKLGDRSRYLEGMYSVLMGSVSQNTYISCEHRHGIQGTQFSFPLGFALARLAVIDDQIEPGSLHLLRFCPLAWLRSDRPARFLQMPTEFGPINLTMQLSEDGKSLSVQYERPAVVEGRLYAQPERVSLHIPPVPGLKWVYVNGKKYAASRKTVIL